MNAKLTLVATLAAVLALTNCKKGDAGPAGSNGSQGPAGPVLMGNLKGYVSTYDLSGIKLLANLNGDTVKIDGTNTYAVTDANGLYTFSGLTTGDYNLTISKPGFGSTKIQGISFTGGNVDLYRNGSISKTPTTNVTSIVATATTITTNSVAVNNINISGTITAQPFAQTVIVFVGNPGATSVSPTSGSNASYYTITVNANLTTFSRNLPTYEFYDLNYVSGNTAYLAAYMMGGNTNASTYVDYTNNKTVFTAISALPITTTVTLQ